MNQARPTEAKDYDIRAKQGKGKKVAEPVKAKPKSRSTGWRTAPKKSKSC